MKIFKNVEKRIFIPAIIVSLMIILPIYISPKKSGEVINIAYEFCINKLGWAYFVTCISCFLLLIWLVFGRYANVKIGKRDEKPEYSDFAWIAMMFTAGVGISIVIMGFLEPIYYLTDPPFGIEVMSEKAYEYAHMYGQFHWGISAWAFYTPATVAISYAMYVRKDRKIRLSTACRPILGNKSDGFLGNMIDIFVIFGIVASISTSLGIGTPVVTDIIRYVFGIPEKYSIYIKSFVLFIWIIIFVGSLYLGMEKGLKNLSIFNIVLALIVMIFIFAIGPTVSMIKSEINTIGLYFQNFIILNMHMEPYVNNGFVERWTVFYWGWWIAFMPMMGIFVARISRGRTIRNIVVGQLLYGSLGCALSFMVFGGYSLYLQKNNIVDIAYILKNKGQSEAVISILNSMPYPKTVMIITSFLCFIYLATCMDSCGYVLAGTATKSIGRKEEPERWHRILWSIIFCALSIGLMVIGGFEVVQAVSIIAAIPLILVIFILIASNIKMLKGLEKDK